MEIFERLCDKWDLQILDTAGDGLKRGSMSRLGPVCIYVLFQNFLFHLPSQSSAEAAISKDQGKRKLVRSEQEREE